MGALAHFDFNQAGAHAYEQALMTIRQLGLAMASVEEQFRRMVFNIVARNQDDHVKNIAFLMDKNGTWSLAPAFDLTYSYNPSGAWTASHQMTMNGKRDGFTRADFEACARAALMKRGRGATLAGIRGGGVACRRGPELAPGEPGAERASFGDVVLVGRLRGEIHRLNPAIPAGAQEEALRKVLHLATPLLVQTNRAFQKMLRDGVDVEYPRSDGSLKGDTVRLVDFAEPAAND